MGETARRYAQALYDLCPQEEALTGAARTLEACPPLGAALNHPCVSQGGKVAVLDRVLEDAPAEVRHFFALLCRRGRLGLLPQIQAAFHDLVLAGDGAARGLLRSARPLTPEQTRALAAALAERRGLRRVELESRVEPDLLGGFVLEAQGVTYDQSLTGALRALGQSLK